MAKVAKMSHKRVVVEFSMEEWLAVQRILRHGAGSVDQDTYQRLVLELVPTPSPSRAQVRECPLCRRDVRLIDGRLMPHPPQGRLCAATRREVDADGRLVPEPPLVRLK